MVERHTREMLAYEVANDDVAWRPYPTPKGDKETKPGKGEDTAIDVNWVEAWD